MVKFDECSDLYFANKIMAPLRNSNILHTFHPNLNACKRKPLTLPNFYIVLGLYYIYPSLDGGGGGLGWECESSFGTDANVGPSCQRHGA